MKNRPSKLQVDISAILNNYNIIQKLQPDKKILPILKAKGYGIGLETIGTLINKLHIDTIGVAIVDEGIELRESLNYDKEIIVLNQPSIEEIDNILEYNITTGGCYFEFLQELGVQQQNLETFVNSLSKLKNIEIEGIYTHFAASDTDLEFTRLQIENFNKAVEYIKSKISTIKYVHCGNSGAIIQIKNLPGNMVRPGIMLYGYLPDESLKGKVQLTPSCVLKSKITFIKEVEENTSISYGRKFITKRKSKIANVPIGYADGIPRSLSNSGNVIVQGNKVPIVGTIYMDSFMIDVTELENVQIGNEVYIWDNKKITIEEIAKKCNTINYEILSTISNRVIREII